MPFHPRELLKHFIKHRMDFQVTSDKQYELLAENFMTGPLHQDLKQCKRKSGDILRYDVVTEEFGILASKGLVRSYYKPVPCWTLPVGSTADCHQYRDNLTYFNFECNR